MGDGELSGTGIEIAGAVTLKVSLIKSTPLDEPVIEDKDAVYMLATRDTFEDGMQAAVARAVDLISRKNDISFPDAYRLLSATCDIRISQVVNGVITAKVKIPRYALNWEGYL
jgi:amidase